MHTAARPSLLHRLGRTCYRRRGRVVVAWLVALVAVIGASSALGEGKEASFDDFESEATQGFDLLEQGFGATAGGNEGSIVAVAPDGLEDAAVREELTTVLDEVARIPGVEVVSPFSEEGARQVATQGPLAGQLAFAAVRFPADVDFDDVRTAAVEVRDVVEAAETPGLRLELGGGIFADFEPPDSEAIGLGFAVIILIFAFGSVLAMGLPIGVALAGIVGGVGLTGILTQLVAMPDFTMTIQLMLGIGVGIDYALFIVTRYREDRHDGMGGEAAAAHAIDTAGRAVLFAGTTVIISVLGMLAMGLGFISGLGIGAAVAVASTLVASITLLPALLGFVGERIELTRRRGIVAAGLVAAALIGTGLKIDAAAFLVPAAVVVLVVGLFLPALKAPLPPRAHKPVRETFWYRYSRAIQHHPWRGALLGFGALVVLALPVFGLRLGFSDEGNYPEDSTTRQAYDLLAEGFGPGSNGPLLLVAAVPPDADDALLAGIADAASSTPGVAFAAPPRLSPDGSVAQWFVLPETGPQDEATAELVRTLRTSLDGVTAGTGLDVLVTSNTAVSIDVSSFLAGRYPLFFGVVLGLSFLLLLAVFRSVLVPLKAVLMNLLSIGAAYGIVVAIFQWGWLAGVFGVSASGAPIEPFVPMMLFAIVFGLSMDYEVFLLSRMKEEYDRTGDNAGAVADGLAVTARVITAAAAIMVVVFGSFLLESDRVVKLMGVGLAVAVLLDATVVRMLLVPSTMELLGDRNWWLPRWLDRVLPRIHIEGAPAETSPAAQADDEGAREAVVVSS